MCLDNVTSNKEDPDFEADGYAVCRKDRNGKFHPIFNRTRMAYPVGQWCETRRPKAEYIEDYTSKYLAGFHVWRTLRAASAWRNEWAGVVVRVRGKHLLVRGTQCGHRVYVFKSRKILGELSPGGRKRKEVR